MFSHLQCACTDWIERREWATQRHNKICVSVDCGIEKGRWTRMAVVVWTVPYKFYIKHCKKENPYFIWTSHARGTGINNNGKQKPNRNRHWGRKNTTDQKKNRARDNNGPTKRIPEDFLTLRRPLLSHKGLPTCWRVHHQPASAASYYFVNLLLLYMVYPQTRPIVVTVTLCHDWPNRHLNTRILCALSICVYNLNLLFFRFVLYA